MRKEGSRRPIRVKSNASVDLTKLSTGINLKTINVLEGLGLKVQQEAGTYRVKRFKLEDVVDEATMFELTRIGEEYIVEKSKDYPNELSVFRKNYTYKKKEEGQPNKPQTMHGMLYVGDEGEILNIPETLLEPPITNKKIYKVYDVLTKIHDWVRLNLDKIKLEWTNGHYLSKFNRISVENIKLINVQTIPGIYLVYTGEKQSVIHDKDSYYASRGDVNKLKLSRKYKYARLCLKKKRDPLKKHNEQGTEQDMEELETEEQETEGLTEGKYVYTENCEIAIMYIPPALAKKAMDSQ